MKGKQYFWMAVIAALMLSVSPVIAAGAPDTGFRPETNGFSFENYGEGNKDLTSVEMRRMFGDQVCASLAGGECVLTPAAKAWMEEQNKSMQGGHCYGFAVLSQTFHAYQNIKKPDEFGSSTVPGLTLDNNEALQREIAYWMALQSVDGVSSSFLSDFTPKEAINKLISEYSGMSSEKYIIGIFGDNGGHAITPYAVSDIGSGIYHILSYDNNYPGKSVYILVDANADTWTYSLAALNPTQDAEAWKGDANSKTLTLIPVTPHFKQPYEPSFLATNQTRRSNGEPFYNEIYLSGSADLYISDAQGKKYGYVQGVMVKEIPGVKMRTPLTGSNPLTAKDQPVYYVPVGMEFSIIVDAFRLQEPSTASVRMIGPGYYLEIEDIFLEPGQSDQIDFSPDGKTIRYASDANESPDVWIGMETSGADYEFLLKSTDAGSITEFYVYLDTAKGDLAVFNIAEGAKTATYDFVMARIDTYGLEYFYQDFQLGAGGVGYLNYLEWKAESRGVYFDIDKNGDGNVDETIELINLGLAGDFGEYGLYLNKAGKWNWVAGDPEAIDFCAGWLIADFGDYGLYAYDGINWTWIAGNPASIKAWGHYIAADFTGYGLYLYDGAKWNWLSQSPEDMEDWWDVLVIDYGSVGLWTFNGAEWKQIGPSPEGMAQWWDLLAADFGDNGLYLYDGSIWKWIAGNPEKVIGWMDYLVVDSGTYGLYLYDGSNWKWIAGNPENIASWGDKLAADFGNYGIYAYDGEKWTWIGGDPQNIAAD